MNRHVAVWNAAEFYRNRRGVSWIGYRGGRRTPGGGRLRGWLCDRIGPPSIRSPNASWKRGRDDVTAPWVLRESQCGCRASSRPAAIRMVRVEASGRWSTNGTIWRTVAASASPAACETNTRRRWYPLKSEATTSLTAEDSKQSSSANFNVFCCCCCCCFYIANSFWLVVVLLSNSDHSIGLRTFSALSATTNCSSYTKKAAGRKKRERQWRGGKREREREVDRDRDRETETERERETERACANLQAIQRLGSRVEDWMELNGPGQFYSSGRGEVRALTGPQRHPSVLMGPHGRGNRPIGGGRHGRMIQLLAAAVGNSGPLAPPCHQSPRIVRGWWSAIGGWKVA